MRSLAHNLAAFFSNSFSSPTTFFILFYYEGYSIKIQTIVNLNVLDKLYENG
ncbi:hypothetical protein B4133_2356 [Bacillus altitudinis]|nr:hypothetical protein B4133_2356 [Bacillus altitudinis]